MNITPDRTLVLIVSSLLSILLLTIHLTEDIVRGLEPGGLSTQLGVLILVVWLYATLFVSGRRSGLLLILLASLTGAGVPVVHMMGPGLAGGRAAASGGMFVWVLTLLALGVSALFSAVLASQLLIAPRRSDHA